MRRYSLLGILLLALSFVWGPVVHAQASDNALERGLAAYDAEDYETARELLLPLAEAGNAKAQEKIGWMYFDGLAFPQKEETGCDWFEKAASLGSISGTRNLASCFLMGDGRPLDLDDAIRLFKPLAENGDVQAKIKLGMAFREKDERRKYVQWVKEAADDGSKVAQVLLFTGGEGHLAPHIGWLDVGCIYLFNIFLDKPFDYCDD